MNSQRVIYLDILKILAILLVIFNHSHFYIYNTNGFIGAIHVILFDFCKIAVPLFVMASGALLLGRESSYKEIFCKRIWRVLVPLIFITMIYSLMYGDNVKEFFLALFMNYNDQYNPYWLWYLYMIMGLYILTPFLQKMIKNFTNKDFKWFILLFVIIISIFNILPVITSMFLGEAKNIRGDFVNLFFPVAIGYYVAGYYFSKQQITSKMNLISIITLIISILIGSIFMYYGLFYQNLSYDDMIDYSFITVAIPALCVFIICKYYLNKSLKNERLNQLVLAVSCSVFGVYLFHVFLLEKIYKLGFIQTIFDFNQIIGIFILDILVFIILTVFIYLLRKIPLIKKFL